MTRLRTALRVLPVVALLAFGVIAPLSSAASGPKTLIQVVSPLNAAGAVKATYHVTRHLGHGVCQTGSYQTGSAYRCASPEAADGTLDPCWPLTSTPSTVVCQAEPWDHKVVELHVVGTATGGPSSRGTTLPWGLRIGANVRCLRDVGAVLKVSGELLLYHCSHHRDVFAPLHTSGSRWQAHVYRNDAPTATGEESLGFQAVTLVWRGAPLASAASPSDSPTPTDSPTATDTPTPTATPTVTPSD